MFCLELLCISRHQLKSMHKFLLRIMMKYSFGVEEVEQFSSNFNCVCLWQVVFRIIFMFRRFLSCEFKRAWNPHRKYNFYSLFCFSLVLGWNGNMLQMLVEGIRIWNHFVYDVLGWSQKWTEKHRKFTRKLWKCKNSKVII